MARPFPTTFNEDSSMSPQSAGASNTPISYRADVNRTKTKKWTQAAAVDYGGDDWGDEDDYGYGYEPPLPPVPVSKPTGLRQQGQSLHNQPGQEQSSVDSSKPYGQIQSIPSAQNNPRGRSNSFEEGAERDFSNATVDLPTAAPAARPGGPATRFSQITGLPPTRDPRGPALSVSTQPGQTTGLRKANPVVSPTHETAYPDVPIQSTETFQTESDPTSADTRTSSSDFQARRDFSPSAVPQPLSTRPSPAPQGPRDRSTSATRFPARKSSLSQSATPDLTPTVPRPEDATPPTRKVDPGRSASPGAAARSPTSPSTGKNLPFIRPSDIYKRAEEERQSMESGRPSMDSLMGGRESFDSPGRQRQRSFGSEGIGGTGRGRTSLDDESEAGRRLGAPMLDTVKERKSEYGFDGFNLNDQSEQAKAHEATTSDEIDHLHVKKARRSSTSPKLPDVNRISGFGMDMFSSRPTEPERPASDATAEPALPHRNETSLHSQPSIGLRSVVHQAFDRTDDSSVPPTPASRTGSGVRRTDSESTGTTGISPIMSRVPSAAVPESRNRDFSTPAILEAVNEPNSPVRDDGIHAGGQISDGNLSQPQAQQISGLTPGYRRDISTPSSENSPAGTPDIGTSSSYSQGHEAFLANPGDSVGSEHTPVRPLADREKSFRPSLPGGWISYAASSQSDATGQDSDRGQISRNLTPEPQTSSQVNDDDVELTPTTTRQALPQFSLEADQTEEGPAAGGPFGKHDGESSRGMPIPTVSRNIRSEDSLPTPDPAMAPSGNVYSKTPLDPRLLPKLQKAPAETQLRPDVVHRAVSVASSVGPTPPPKDTPQMIVSDESAGYFSSLTVPTKEKSVGQTPLEHTFEPPQRPEGLPILSTDSQPQTDENDRLRSEIVKQLSPQPSTPSRYDNAMLTTPGEEQGGHRESTYLPSEYDNYWAATADDSDNVSIPPVEQTLDGVENAKIVPVSQKSSFEPETPPVPPLNPRRSQHVDTSSLPSLQPRFSWEQSAESVPGSASQTNNAPGIAAQNDPTISVIEPPKASSSNPDESMVTDASLASQIPAPAYSDLMLDESQSEASWDEPEEKTLGRKSTFLTGGAVLGAGALGTGATAAIVERPSERSNRRLSLAEEKEPQSSSYPVSPSPPEDEHPARSPDPYFPPTAIQPPQTEPVAAAPAFAPPQQQPNESAVPPSFKDIAGMKSQQDRIAAFNNAREYYGHVDHGLRSWLQSMEQQHPEHADTSASRPDFENAGATASGPLHQPYYQQYLNASSPITPISAGGSKPAAGMSSNNTPQGFALPGGGKLTGQQVQAKGKEFLHTAGIFGGKAGKAGKGLLAKGKSRFSKSGGGEKTSPPANTKPERRSSWGPLKSLSRTSDSSTQQRNISTAETILPQTPSMHHQRNSMSQFSTFTDVDHADSFRGPHSTFDSQVSYPVGSSVSHEVPQATTNGPPVGPQNEPGINVSVPSPAPPSHLSHDDVYQSTTIAENEDPLRYCEPPNRTTLHPGANDSLQAPMTPTARSVASGRSSSEDTRFYSAAEDGSPDREWVMVSTEPDMNVVDTREPPVAANVPTTPSPTTEVNERPFHATPGFAPSTNVAAQAPVGSELEMDRAANIVPLPSPVLAVPTSQQKAEVLAEPELPQSPPAPLGGPSTENEAASIPPKHSLHRKRASMDLAEGAPMAAYEFPRHSVSRSPEIGVPMTAHSSNMDQPEVSPIREVDPTTSWLGSGPKSHRPSASTTSVMDRPRGASVDEHISPIQAQSPTSLNQPFSSNGQAPNQLMAATPSHVEHQQPQQTGKSTFLPPIRRTSTFGIGFGSRQKQSRFPIEDDERGVPENYTPAQAYGRNEVVSGGSAAYDGRRESQASLGPDPTVEEASVAQSSPIRPKIVRVSDQSQRAITGQQPDSSFPTSGMVSAQSEPFDTWQSQDSSRPNVASSSGDFRQSTDNPRNSWEPQQRVRGMSGSNPNLNQRPDGNYVERAPWGSSANPRQFEQPPSSAQRYPELFKGGVDTPPRSGGDLPAQYYQQPIPREEAFLPRQQTSEYQLEGVGPPAPDQRRSTSRRRNSGQFFRELGGRLSRGTSRERGGSRSREDGFSSPQQPLDSQGNDYSASRVASEEGKEQNKKRSNFFGMPSRASTTGLGTPQSRESVVAHHSGSRTDLLTSGPEPPAPERKRSFFGSSSGGTKTKNTKLSRASTSGAIEDPGKKKRFSGLTGFFGKSESGSRTSMPPPTRPNTTRQLSSNGRQSVGSSSALDTIYPYATSPANGYQQFPPNSSQPVTNGGARTSSRSRILGKFAVSPAPQSPQLTASENRSRSRRPSAASLLSGIMGRKSYQNEKDKSDESRSQGSASQRGTPQPLPPARTYTDLQEEERRQQLFDQQYQQASVSSGAPPHQISGAQQEPASSNRMFDSGANHSDDRGRRVNREPQYDDVPIPGGYDLVRGQGARTVPTEYDPRGLNQFQQPIDTRIPGQKPFSSQHNSLSEPVYPAHDSGAVQYTPTSLGHSSPGGFQQTNAPTQDSGHSPERFIAPQYQNHQAQHMNETPAPSTVQSATRNKPPSFGALESFETYQARSAGHRISSEDLIARSPARLPQGQQRPYQLSLPHDQEDTCLPPSDKDSAAISAEKSQNFPNTKPKHDSIQRLQNPAVRHSGSPDHYPLPESNFSPINPGANVLPPPPPPPGWEGQSSHLDTKYSPAHSPLLRQNGFGSNIDRSNTHRTAVSSISHLSGADQSYTTTSEAATGDKEIGRVNTTSTDGPSPVITPERTESPRLTVTDERGRRDNFGTSRENTPIKTTTLDLGDSSDLYDASPRLPVAQTLTAPPPKQSPKVSPIRTSFANNRATPVRVATPEPQTIGNTLAPGGGVVKRSVTPAHEEKEVVGNGGPGASGGGNRGTMMYEMDGEPSLNMSATSYPGQEWNPYAGGYESD